MNLKTSFIKLALYQKIEIYLLVIMFYGVILFSFDDIFIQKNSSVKLPQKDTQYKNKIQNLKLKIKKRDNSYLVKLIEQKAEEFGCFIYDLKIKENNFDIRIRGNLFKVINFLNYLQNHLIINRIELSVDKKIFNATITLNTKYFYNPNKIYNEIVNIPNPFINLTRDNKPKEKIDTKLYAIIASNVFINNRWYRLNDVVNNKKIVSIDLNCVELIDIKTKIKTTLKVYKDE